VKSSVADYIRKIVYIIISSCYCKCSLRTAVTIIESNCVASAIKTHRVTIWSYWIVVWKKPSRGACHGKKLQLLPSRKFCVQHCSMQIQLCCSHYELRDWLNWCCPQTAEVQTCRVFLGVQYDRCIVGISLYLTVHTNSVVTGLWQLAASVTVYAIHSLSNH